MPDAETTELELISRHAAEHNIRSLPAPDRGRWRENRRAVPSLPLAGIGLVAAGVAAEIEGAEQAGGLAGGLTRGERLEDADLAAGLGAIDGSGALSVLLDTAAGIAIDGVESADGEAVALGRRVFQQVAQRACRQFELKHTGLDLLGDSVDQQLDRLTRLLVVDIDGKVVCHHKAPEVRFRVDYIDTDREAAMQQK